MSLEDPDFFFVGNVFFHSYVFSKVRHTVLVSYPFFAKHFFLHLRGSQYRIISLRQ